jgi:GNAT superfamily N-acetyltransferase
MSYLTVALNSSHKKEKFSCGKTLPDNYLHKQAKQDVKRKLSACFILEGEDYNVKGYYTLSNSSINRVLLPESIIKKLPQSYSYLPVTLLGRLAVDNSYQGQGLGELLILDALKRSYDISDSVGSMAVIVDPIDEGATMYYGKYGFVCLPDSHRMFILMDTAKLLF